jgi:transposase InsO family protein
MKSTLLFIWHLIVAFVKLCKPGGYRKLVAENAALRHQLLVMTRSKKRAPKLSSTDRFLFGLCSLWMTKSRLIKTAIIIKPSTLLKFHKALIEKKYSSLFSSKSKRKTGSKGPSQELINAILEMKCRNPRFGCPRIAQQINLAFGLDIDKDVVRRILEKHDKPTSDNNGPSWLTFLGHTKDSLWSVDFFRCESANLKSYWVMLVMDQFTRSIIGFDVNPGDLNGVAICRMFNDIRSKQTLPRYLSSDNDPLFKYHRWQANLRVLDIEEIKTVPYTPISHPFVERLIGTVRRELLDQTLFWNSVDLERKLGTFKNYYNQQRTHSGRNGKTPIENCSKSLNFNNFGWRNYCRGLFSLPCLA